ncbi:hypothetical protein BH20ACI2_BH20ACI2_20990 [soil metagenome]
MRISVPYIAKGEPPFSDRLINSNGQDTQNGIVSIDTAWDGRKCADGREFTCRLYWSDSEFGVQFIAQQNEPLVVADEPDLAMKTPALWNRDVCEIFIAPDRNEPRRYYEFEVAPTGEWLDLAIDMTSEERITDWEYRSGMEIAARIKKGRVLMAMKIPWNAFGRTPKAGDVWLGNMFRCVGIDPTRGYLAWQPTKTATPNFHVPEKFGEFWFVK